MNVFVKCSFKVAQTFQHQPIASASIFGCRIVVGQFGNACVTHTFALMFHLHHTDGVCHRSAVHRSLTVSCFGSLEQFEHIGEQHFFFLTQMGIQFTK